MVAVALTLYRLGLLLFFAITYLLFLGSTMVPLFLVMLVERGLVDAFKTSIVQTIYHRRSSTMPYLLFG